jgi:hypothetical protein
MFGSKAEPWNQELNKLPQKRERKPASPLPCRHYFLALRTAPPSIKPPRVIKPRRLEGSGTLTAGVGTVSTEEMPYRGRGLFIPKVTLSSTHNEVEFD